MVLRVDELWSNSKTKVEPVGFAERFSIYMKKRRGKNIARFLA